MNLTWGFFLFILLFNSFSTIPQQQTFAFKNININDGLSQNSVVDIVEDDTGFIWFATQDGLNRYDGRNFTVFPVSFDDITSPDNAQLGKLMAAGNEIWMIKRGGIIEKLDLFTHKITPVKVLGKEEEPLPPASFIYLDKAEGLWIGTFNDGLFYLDKEGKLHKFTEESAPPRKIISNHIRFVFEDSSGAIWVLTDLGVTRIYGETTEDYLATINTNVLTEAPDKRLWLGSLGQGIFVKEPGSEGFEPYRGDAPNHLSEALVVETIHADEQNRIWVGTYGEGLYIIEPSSQVSHLMPDRQDPYALSFQDILSIREDSKGGIWIGTDGGGVSYYNRQLNNFKTIAIQNVSEDISIEQIRAIVTDDEGMVWLGTSGQGFTKYNPFRKKFETFHLEPFQPGISNYDRIVSLQVDSEGDLWIGTQGNGLLVMDRQTKEIKQWFTTEAGAEEEQIPDNTIWSILPQGNDQMWVATRNAGLLLMHKEKGLLENYILSANTSGEQKGANVQSLIKVNKTTLALGLEKEGINLLDIPSGKFTAISNSAIEKTLNEETGIKSLFYEDDWLWAGTAGKGVLITNLKTGKTYLLDDKNWLPNNMIYSILPEKKGTVWMSSNKGIFRISYVSNSEEININQIYHFTVEDRLQSNEFNTGAFHGMDNGTLFFGGISGLTYFHPAEITFHEKDLAVVLTEAMVGNIPIEEDTLITYRNRLKLDYKQNSLSFNYTALDFVSPDNLHFQYKMEGYDENWIYAGSRNYTAYTNLPPNDYTFKIKISDKTSADAPVTSLMISIAVPFWQQWWFVLLLIAGLSIFIYGMHRYRIYQLMQVQKVKNNISADLHDDLGARLTNIRFLSAISKQKLTNADPEYKILEGIEEELEASAKALDEIVWNIKMKDESLDEIIAKMRKYAGEMLEPDHRYQLDVKGKFARKKMSMQKRREIFLVYKELLNNIRKHAGATEVIINISVEDDKFLLTVKDNGKGFDPREKTHRNGLRNIKERVRSWYGSMHLQSYRNKGTIITLKIPFDHWYVVY